MKNIMRPLKKCEVIILFFLLQLNSPVHTEELQTDCVGRMQISLFDHAELSATTLNDIKKKWNPPASSFVDNQIAGWSGIAYLGGIEIVHGLTSNELDAFMKERKIAKDNLKKLSKKKTSQLTFLDLSIEPQKGFGFQTQGSNNLTLRIGEHIFLWTGYSGLSESEAQHDVDAIIKNLRPREIFESPQEEGVCLPYAFIKDNGKTTRHIAMTYRIKSHPDITIFLEDSNARSYDNPIRSENAEPKNRLNDFWGQYELSATGKQVESIWRFPSARPVKIAGQNGLASFVKITRKNNSIDYGYLAVVRGDPDAKKDTPDLRFYVIREADHAKAKGFEPVNEKDFLEMAQAIAASIKHRPTK